MRQPDKPGTYRIRRKIDGSWWLGGLQESGNRVRSSFQSESEARAAADVLFGTRQPPPPISKPAPNTSMDDWGIPLSVNPELAANVNATLGVPPPLPVNPEPLPAPPVDEKKRAEDKERAKSLCEFLGIGWAAGDVWLAKKMTLAIGKDPANPSISQVNNLAKAGKTAFVDLLGDLEVGPWTMLMLLSIALPASMMIQSRALPKKPKEDSGVKTEETSSPVEHLKSV